MNNSRLAAARVGVAVVGLWCLAPAVLAQQEDRPVKMREQARKLDVDGNFKDSYELYVKLLAQAAAAEPADVFAAVHCLQRLGRESEVDGQLEKVAVVGAGSWRLLQAVGQSYFNANHYGFVVAGDFLRGHHRGGGRWVGSQERDRVRAMQLMEQARQLILADEQAEGHEVAGLFAEYARFLVGFRGHDGAWRLQYLTDFEALPDYEDGNRHYGGGGQGAPVDAAGNPVYHTLPESFEAAATDGQRWRWLLMQAMEYDRGRTAHVLDQFASFLRHQFGVQTLREYPGLFGLQADGGDESERRGSLLTLHTLAEQETVAKLATGVKRFELPDEFNFIRIYRQLAEMGAAAQGYVPLDHLARIFTDRRQYPQAAEFWRQAIAVYGAGADQFRAKALEQIVGNWARFEPVGMHAPGVTPTVDMVYRNGRRLGFEAFEIKVGELLADVKSYIQSKPKELDWRRLDINDIGQRLVWENQTKYLGPKVAEWSLPLVPAELHFDRRVTIPIPLKQPGAYLVTARMEDGNVSRIVVWIADTVIVEKNLAGRNLYFLADARTGVPVAKANLEFFGYRQDWRRTADGKGNEMLLEVKQFAEFSDADGQVLADPRDLPDRFNWLLTATTPEGRFAYLGFNTIWYGRRHDAEYQAVRVFAITDRPVYRPKQEVKFKIWLRRAQYDQEDVSLFAGRQVLVQIRNPRGDQVFEQRLQTDAYGGLEGSLALPEDATLGVYAIQLPEHGGGGSFRVEEYKKPEFEVKVEAPAEPAMLGDTVTAKVVAKYYFGSPVARGKVKIKVQRFVHAAEWYPITPWDWFYGRGYWWFAYDYDWYPGWRDWCLPAPRWWWYGTPQTPPELVAEFEREIGAEGVVEVDIDTALAKELHGHRDHRYSITAEVTDESRRTIVGSGQVLVARRPFSVHAWVDRGHYRQGDTIQASFAAQTLDQRPVAGRGRLVLYSLSYDREGQPIERPEQEWQLDPDAGGQARQQLVASRPGQYRLAYTVTDRRGRSIEGGYIFVVGGEGYDGREFRFNQLELVPDKREYAAGETVELMINADRAGATVVLFVRPTDGVYLPPKIIRLAGKSAVETIEIGKRDMPNFFVEAFTVGDGRVHTAVREIVVPPEQRVLEVEVLPDALEYLPGAEAEIQIRLTDFAGRPFQGSTAISVYDQAVEYIAGGSNVPEIRAFFWKWRRQHQPRTRHSLEQVFHNLLKKKEVGMGGLGAFGDVLSGVDGEMMVGFGAAPGAGGVNRRGVKGMALGGMVMEAAGASRELAFSAAPMVANAMMAAADQADDDGGGGGVGGGAEEVAPAVRSEFADTAFWAGTVDTDADGLAKVAFKMPENLTGWKVRTWAMGHGTKVGQGEALVVTRKNIMLRLQAPRFFVETDEVVLSANVHNYLAEAKQVRAVLELEGDCLEGLGPAAQVVQVEAGGERRVDWRVNVRQAGEAVVRMKALTEVESDAMEMRFPVYVHGMDKMVSFSGVIRPEASEGVVVIEVPVERRVNDSRLVVNYSPTLAGAMVDALPYLASYPYGCTEQTLNRFLPTVVTQKVLLEMGVDLAALREKRSNLNAQELGDPGERARQWQRWNENPVFDVDEVQRMVRIGVRQLTSMQNGDGGWGWFSGWGERSYPHTTSVVVHGLRKALDNDVALVPGVLERGVDWLKRYQAEQVELLVAGEKKPERRPWKASADNLDALIYMILSENQVDNPRMRDYLYRDRTHLAVYGLAAFGIGLHQVGDADKLAMVLRNIEQYLVLDAENQTAWLRLPNANYWWHWYGGEIEAHAFYLKLLARTEPTSDKAAGLVKYLLNNRKHASYWNSTRDTAYCLEAMAEYLQASGEDKPDLTVDILVDGRQQKQVRITADTLFDFDARFELFGDAIDSGRHEIKLVKTGKGPLYYNAYLSYFTLEPFISAAGLEVKVDRQVYRLVEDKEATAKVAGNRGQALDQRLLKYRREPLNSGDTLVSGDLIEIEMAVDSKNDYEYIVIEDMKAAGFEPVDLRSGYTGNDLGAYVEFRDERVAFFVRALARGRHSVSYRLRAEIPGQFSALPTRISAMYAPELRGNSDEIKLSIVDQ